MRTRIYIDGYNLYYGCLKGTPYKWLNLFELFSKYILPRTSVSHAHLAPMGINFYTAEIVDKAATDRSSVNDQRSYHQALHSHCKNELKIIKGYYSVDQTKAPRVDGNKWPRDCSRVDIWKLEEKQSDVNIAVDALYDAIMEPDLEQVVFVTNDTDIAPALVKIKAFNEQLLQKGQEGKEAKRSPIHIGLVIPTTNNTRQANAELSQLADWTVKNILKSELQATQLPWKVLGGKKPAIKPVSWYQYSNKVSEILEILSEVEGSTPKCWRWLASSKPKPAGLPELNGEPVHLLNCSKGIDNVLEHAKAYRAYKQSRGVL